MASSIRDTLQGTKPICAVRLYADTPDDMRLRLPGHAYGDPVKAATLAESAEKALSITFASVTHETATGAKHTLRDSDSITGEQAAQLIRRAFNLSAPGKAGANRLNGSKGASKAGAPPVDAVPINGTAS